MSTSDAQVAEPKLSILDIRRAHTFLVPVKRINEGRDVPEFLMSKAYCDITSFLLQLNSSMFPRLIQDPSTKTKKCQHWDLGSPDVSFSATVIRIRGLLNDLDKIIEEVPPDPGPRRFGNVSFRKWYELVESRAPTLLEQYLPGKICLPYEVEPGPDPHSELVLYLLGSFGSAQRLDYGTGHELSFLAFLGCLWKLGAFDIYSTGEEERGIVLGVIEPYLELVRRLIKTYTLEPAGSHGVWGLDDHSFLPYIFGSAQYAPAVSESHETPTEGSREDAPNPADVAKSMAVERERSKNMYFSAIAFIYDVKKGPFWEHSPMLYDISGVRAGWAKINKGLIKMYHVEVLSKFPVVQHFRFGSLFSWDQDPNAAIPSVTAHTSSQPSQAESRSSSKSTASLRGFSQPLPSMKAPWAVPETVSPNSGLGTPASRANRPEVALSSSILPSRTAQPGSARISQQIITPPIIRMPVSANSHQNDSHAMPPPKRLEPE